ncbi:MAG: ABC transporter permease subunit [Lentisphaerae bacterium]|nr:ABC transporter permease subunit [Lentisphaerota bacterium]
MTNIITLLKRQLRAYFHGATAYVIMLAFLTAAGLSFCRTLAAHLGKQMGLSELLFNAPDFWVAVLGAIALITMGLFAEERRSGTLETLLTMPVTDLQVVLGKFAGAFLFFLLLTIPTVIYFILLQALASGLAALDPAPIFAGYLILWLMGACFIAAGMFISALARSQIVAASVCFLALSILFFLDTASLVVSGAAAQEALSYLSSAQHIRDFAQGIVDTRPVALYLSLSLFFIFATVKVIEARQWK